MLLIYTHSNLSICIFLLSLLVCFFCNGRYQASGKKRLLLFIFIWSSSKQRLEFGHIFIFVLISISRAFCCYESEERKKYWQNIQNWQRHTHNTRISLHNNDTHERFDAFWTWYNLLVCVVEEKKHRIVARRRNDFDFIVDCLLLAAVGVVLLLSLCVEHCVHA